MQTSRRIAGVVALVSYLVMGAMFYFTVIPAAGGLMPPDFHLRGYDVVTIAPFVQGLTDEGRDTYALILARWDRVFIISFAVWLTLVGWRGGGLKYGVAGLAALYVVIDLAENAAIYRFLCVLILDPASVAAASQWTMAKFASLYLCILVLVWHLRRPR